MKHLALSLCLIASPVCAAEPTPTPPAAPQIQPTDQFTVTLTAAAWQSLIASTDSKALSNEIARQIHAQFDKAHLAKK